MAKSLPDLAKKKLISNNSILQTLYLIFVRSLQAFFVKNAKLRKVAFQTAAKIRKNIFITFQ